MHAFRLILRALLVIVLLFGIYVILNLPGLFDSMPVIPNAGDHINDTLLFSAGLLTGLHCVGMCGALVVGYTVKSANTGVSRYITHFSYAVGKTLSYTIIGALFGAVGAIITFTPFLRGMAGILSGIFLVLFGLSTLDLFPVLGKFRIKTPSQFMRRLGLAYRSTSNPFVIGLLNGLMVICGPLQAMYILAAGTGQPLEGARMLFVFGLGTLPAMLSFGLLASTLSRQFAPKIVRASGVIVLALGVVMFNRGMALATTSSDRTELMTSTSKSTTMASDHVMDHQHHDQNKVPSDEAKPAHQEHMVQPAPEWLRNLFDHARLLFNNLKSH